MRADLTILIFLVGLMPVHGEAQSPAAEYSPSEIASARRARLDCGGAGQALERHLGETRARAVVTVCRSGRFRIEWRMCVFDHSLHTCGVRWLNAGQRARLARALGDEAPIEPAPEVESAVAVVDQIAVAEGNLADHGAGFGRWLHSTAETCVGVARARGEHVIVEVQADDEHPGTPPPIRVRGASPALESCIRGRLAQLVWTEGTHAAVRARLRIRRRPAGR